MHEEPSDEYPFDPRGGGETHPQRKSSGFSMLPEPRVTASRKGVVHTGIVFKKRTPQARVTGSCTIEGSSISPVPATPPRDSPSSADTIQAEQWWDDLESVLSDEDVIAPWHRFIDSHDSDIRAMKEEIVMLKGELQALKANVVLLMNTLQLAHLLPHGCAHTAPTPCSLCTQRTHPRTRTPARTDTPACLPLPLPRTKA